MVQSMAALKVEKSGPSTVVAMVAMKADKSAENWVDQTVDRLVARKVFEMAVLTATM